MKIRKAKKEDEKTAIKIAASLKDWFTKEALKNIEIDFRLNNLIVAEENNKVVGFLCYSSYCGKILLIWMGVRKDIKTKGAGKELLRWLENKARSLSLYSIEVETLPEEYDYVPYKATRDFYYRNGFKRIFYKKARVKGWDDQIVLEKRI